MTNGEYFDGTGGKPDIVTAYKRWAKVYDNADAPDYSALRSPTIDHAVEQTLKWTTWRASTALRFAVGDLVRTPAEAGKKSRLGIVEGYSWAINEKHVISGLTVRFADGKVEYVNPVETVAEDIPPEVVEIVKSQLRAKCPLN